MELRVSVIDPCKSGDVLDTRTIALTNVTATGTPTADCYVQHVEGGTVETLATTRTSLTPLTFEVALGTWLSDGPTVGHWNVELEVTFDDGSKLTYPNSGFDTIEVIADLNTDD